MPWLLPGPHRVPLMRLARLLACAGWPWVKPVVSPAVALKQTAVPLQKAGASSLPLNFTTGAACNATHNRSSECERAIMKVIMARKWLPAEQEG